MFQHMVIFTLLGIAYSVDYSCEFNRPIGKSEAIRGNVITVTLPEPPVFKHGENFIVHVETVDPDHYVLKQLSIQARDVDRKVWGAWESKPWSAIKQCGTGQMLYTAENIDSARIDLVWKVPGEAFSDVIEFHISVMFNNETYHLYTSQIAKLDQGEEYDPHNAPSEFEEPTVNNDEEEESEIAGDPSENPDGNVGNPGESPNGGEELYGEMSHHADELDHIGETTEKPTVDLHDPTNELLQQREAEEKRQQQIAAEDANSEGDWSIREEEERRQREQEYDWELREQERTQYEEQKRREEIMLWEIRDKEEHDAMIAAQATDPPRNNNTEDEVDEEDSKEEEEEDQDSLESLESDEIDLDNLVEDGDSGVTRIIANVLVLVVAAFVAFA